MSDLPAQVPRVLIVEDEALIAMDLALQVESLGYELIGVASSADGALVKAAEKPADIALVDLDLADGRTGTILAEKLASLYGTAIIIVTAHPRDVTEGEAGIVRIVPKPCTQETIAAALRFALEKRAEAAWPMKQDDTNSDNQPVA
jgi:two-component system, response regulator PdtaR